MTGESHTPGPWDWLAIGANASGGHHLYIIDAADRKIAALWGKAIEKQANARLIAAAPDYDAAAGLAITALAFEQEKAQRAGDELAYRQITTAKDALIAAQNKARGRGQPALRDVTPAAAVIAKAEGLTT